MATFIDLGDEFEGFVNAEQVVRIGIRNDRAWIYTAENRHRFPGGADGADPVPAATVLEQLLHELSEPAVLPGTRVIAFARGRVVSRYI
ncbi:hypothetical protein AB0H71_01870 [Nocardia sp. NPDC050697]|uniref:hypothetical protein n=1 Tax=Nocardia sp. NPDC050697 TaxID=3155158 RepID=UPI0034118919